MQSSGWLQVISYPHVHLTHSSDRPFDMPGAHTAFMHCSRLLALDGCAHTYCAFVSIWIVVFLLYHAGPTNTQPVQSTQLAGPHSVAAGPESGG
jgi:hypothetical protein